MKFLANAKDVDATQYKEGSGAFIDRLTLNEKRLSQMAESLRSVASLSDPVGEVAEERILENGLQRSSRARTAGRDSHDFESRPNVAIEAFSLGFKSGNAMILRGGKESMGTTRVLFSVQHDALKELGARGEDRLWGITDPDRAIPDFLMRQRKNRCRRASREAILSSCT